MARALRIQYPGAYYHVTCRGNERREIYKDEEDREVFKKKLKQSLEMSNHFHLLIQTPQGNLSEFMRHFNISYTSAYNRRHHRIGHLYQGRYKAFLIDADNYLLAVSRYIHLNPIKIKKISKYSSQDQWAELVKYRDSSLAGYIAVRRKEPMVNYRIVLEFMGGDSRKGRQGYKKFIQQAITDEVENPISLGKGSGIIGDNEFIEWVKEAVLKDKGDKREQPALRKSLDSQWLIDTFCELTRKTRDDLCRRGNRTPERAQLMELLYRFCDMKQPEIGRIVGGVDYSAVSQARKRLREKLEGDKELKIKYCKIEEQIVKLSS